MSARMYAKKALCLGTVLTGMVVLMGCCEPGPERRPAAPPVAGMPALLSESTACAKAPASEPVALACTSTRPTGEVRGEMVFNLGQNVISNSSAARLAGGAETPTACYIPSGVMGRCNSVPDRYYQRVAANAMRAGVAAPAAPVGSTVLEPLPEPIQIPELAPAVTYEPSVQTAPEVEGFVMTDEELRAGPEIHVPASQTVEPAPRLSQLRPHAAEEMPAVVMPAPTPAAPAATVVPAAPVGSPAFPADSALAGKSNGEIMPPVPQVSDMDDAVDAVLTRERRINPSGPTIQLPPSLN